MIQKNDIKNRLFSEKYIRDILPGIVKFGIGMALSLSMVMSLSSCSEDKLETPENPVPETDTKYYFTLTVSAPVTTRSYTQPDGTSSSDFIPGTDPESELKNAQMFFCIGDEIKLQLTAAIPTKIDKAGNEYDNSYSISAEIEDLSQLTSMAGQDVKLYVVGNYNTVSKHNFASKKSGATFSIDALNEDPIGDYLSDGKTMPLVNAEEFTLASLSSINKDDGEEAVLNAVKKMFVKNGQEQIYDMGTLKLERAVARIDWKDTDRTNKSTPNRYNIGRTSINADLYDLQLFNVNTSSYLFRHTAKGTDTKAANSAVTPFGVENNDDSKNTYNWIAGSDWEASSDGTYNKNTTFLNPVSTTDPLTGAITGITVTDPSVPGSITIAELTKTNNEGAPVRNLDEDGYYPWCYVTENTLPSISTVASENATGVVFRFKLLNKNGAPLTPDMVKSGSNVPSEIVSESENGKSIRITDNQKYYINLDYTDGDGDAAGFFVTYYGYIVHNDSPNYSSQALPPMYYGVVRNTVYQISVKSIVKLPNPEYPDIIVEMNAKMFPWILRIDDNVVLK